MVLDSRPDPEPDTAQYKSAAFDSDGKRYGIPHASTSTSASTSWPREEKSLPLTATEGRVAMQLYSKHLAGVPDLSLVRGLVKLYDGAGGGTSRDILLYVVGVHVAKVGRLSLVSNWGDDLVPYVTILNDEGGGVGKVEAGKMRR